MLFDAIIDDTGNGSAARQAIADAKYSVAPDLIDLEVTNAIRKSLLRGLSTPVRADKAFRSLRYFPTKRERHELLLPRAWQLRDNFTSYDAVYIALAELLTIPLVTRDKRLANSPNLPCEVILLAERTQ